MKRIYFIIAVAVAGIAGCATYQGKVAEARRYMQDGESARAADYLKPLAEKKSDDQLIYLLDYGTALQSAGDFKGSNQVFDRANELIKQLDYQSVSRIAGSLLFAEELVQYKGDDFEKLFINAMSALNYAMLNDREGAMVEIRRLQEKLEYFRVEDKKEYKSNTFALYLSAIMWEANGNFDSAYIDYKKAYDIDPSIPLLKEDLLRSALRSGREEEARKWQREFGIKPRPEWKSRDMGEIIVIYAKGWGPRKQPDPNSPRFPILVPTFSLTQNAKIRLWEGSDLAGERTVAAEKIYDLESAAIETLRDQYAALVAKRMAGFVAKEVVAHQVSKDDNALGTALWLAMHLSDRADLRQWSSLPAEFQVARLYAPAGTYGLEIDGLGADGVPTGEKLDRQTITVEPRKKTFVYWRSFR